MSISFSGLLSGIDTNSWIESLTALKQAKVETLEEEKESVLLSKETLDSIKNFFTSFRTTIEKITDSKFGIKSMDLFSQKLVNSSAPSIVTATATNEAEENSYDILVDKLASSSEAVSNYSYVTTIVQTTTATLNSKLSSLGVNSGEIGVKVNGGDRTISIDKNDTIGDFIDKLQNIGVDASFNEKTGIFSIALNASDIDDSRFKTGIVDALHLEDNNEGYKTNNSLEMTKEETIYTPANSSTKLSDLGVNSGFVSIKSNGIENDYLISENTTLGDFILALQNNGVNASIDNDGFLEIEDIEIVDEGGTNIKTALGLDNGAVSSNTQVTKYLEYVTTETSTTYATESNLLSEILTNPALQDGDTVIIQNADGNISTITLSTTSTLGELINQLETNGLDVNLSNDGVFTISSGEIIGGSYDLISGLGLTTSVTGSYVSTDSLYTKITTTITATETTELRNYGITSSLTDDERTVNLYNSKQELLGSTIINENTTIEDLLNFINSQGVNANITDGKINITNGYISNNILENSLGLEKSSTSSYVIGSAITSTTTSVIATEQASLGDIFNNIGTSAVVAGGYDLIYDGHNISVGEDTTLGEIISQINSYGGSASLDSSGVLTVTGGSLTGSVADAMGIETVSGGGGSVVTDGQTIYTETTSLANENTSLGDIVNFSNLSGDKLVINDLNGNPTQTVNVSESTSIGDLFDILSLSGFEASITNGVITIKSSSGDYLTGALAEALGISYTTTETGGASQTSTIQITSTTTLEASNTSKIDDIVDLSSLSGTILGVYSSSGSLITTIDVSESDTIESLFGSSGKLSAYGITATITDGILDIETSNGNYIDGSLPAAMGIEVSTNITYTTTGNSVTSSAPITCTIDSIATGSTVLSELGVNNTNNTIVINTSSGAKTTITVSNTSTVNDLLNQIKSNSSNGITGTISDGVITLNSSDGSYITGALADLLGIGINTTTTTISKTSTSTSKVENTTYVTTTVSTTFTIAQSLSDMMSSMEAMATQVESGGLPVAITRMSQSEATSAGYTWVTTAAQLQTALNNNENICLGSDIDMSGISDWQMKEGYSKTFDGNGYTIENFSITSSATNIGLIAITGSGAVLKNIRMENVNITGSGHVGALVGYSNYYDQISNVAVISGTVQGTDTSTDVGGIVGYYSGDEIINAYNNSTVNGNGYSGGIVGYYYDGMITNVYNSGIVTGNSAGGIAGYSTAKIVNAYNSSTITGQKYTGGIAGKANVNIENAYNSGSVNGDSYTAGIAGQAYGTVINAYNNGNITGKTYTGGISGQIESDVINSYNKGTVSGEDKTGGIVGSANSSIINCINSNINTVKGIIGTTTSDFTSHYTVVNSYYNNALTDTYGTAISASEAEAKINAGLNTTFNGNIAMTLSTVTFSTTSTLSDLGLSSNAYITVNNSGSDTVVTIASSDTVQDLIDKLSSYGITGSVSDGKLTLSGDSTHYIKGMTDTLSTALKLQIGENYTYTSQINYSNTSSSQQGDTSISTLKTSETLANYGLSGSEYITVVQNGTEKIITVDSSKTVDSIFSELNSLGITTSLIDGKVTLSGNENSYILGISTDLQSVLNLKSGEGFTWVTDDGAIYTTTGNSVTSSTPLTCTIDSIATGSTVLSELGVNNTNNTIVINTSSGTKTTITVSNTSTVNDLLNQIKSNSSNGITGTISNGVITLNSSDGSYITGALANLLGIGINTTTTTISKTSTSTSKVENTTYVTTTVSTTFTIAQSLSDMMSSMEAMATQVESGGLPVAITRMSQSEATSAGYTWVTTAEQLQTALNNNENICLGSDIDMSGISDWQMKEGYSSTFDGNGYTIENFSITSSATNIGLIASTGSGAVLKNIRMENVNVSGTASGYDMMQVGALLGTLSASSAVTNIAVLSGTISGTGINVSAGGIIGSSGRDGATVIDNVYNSANVYGEHSAGGIIGSIFEGTITNAYNSGSITSVTDAGGIAGYTYKSIVSYVYNTGDITASSDKENTSANAGGIIGATNYGGGSVSNAYNSGTITTLGNSFGCGGIVGDSNCAIFNVYNAGSINGASYTGGITGYSTDNISYAYNSGNLSDGACGIADTCGGIIENCINSSSTGSEGLVHSGNIVTNSYYNGALTNGYGTAISASEAEAKINAGLNTTYNGSIATTATETFVLDTTSILSSFGLSSNAYITVTNSGSDTVVTIASSDTVQDMIDKLSSYGITGSVSDGKLTLSGDSTHYIKGMTDTLSTALKLQIGENYTYTSQINYSNTSSSQQGDTSISTLKTNETLANYGLSGSEYITVVQNGTEKIITVDSSKTVDSIFSELNSLGITTSLIDGKITLSGNENSYILGISSALQDVLSLEAGQGHTWTSTSNAIFTTAGSSVTSASPITYTIDSIATGSTVLSELGVNNTNNTIVINTSSGAKTTITVSNTSTVNDLLNQIKSNSSNGITGSISNGVITLNSSDGSYITGALADLLGIGINATTTTISKTSTSTSKVENTTYVTTTVSTTFTIAQSLSDMMSSMEAMATQVESGGLPVAITRMSKSEATSAGYTWVTTAAQLQAALNNNTNICLGADIDMSGISNWQMKEGYSKTFDGNGYTIENFSITSSATNVGLIASTTSGAVLKNIRMENVNIVGSGNNVGALVGYSYQGQISNVAVVSGTVQGTGASTIVSGIIGRSNDTEFSNLYNSSNVTSSSYIAGGIVGQIYLTKKIEFSNLYNKGNISAYEIAGGIIAETFASSTEKITITNVYNIGGVVTTGDSNTSAGGILGESRCTSLKNAYNTGDIDSTHYAGGIVGYNTGSIYNAYNTNSRFTSYVSGRYAGGIVGLNTGEIYNAYNNADTHAHATYTSGGIVCVNNSGIISDCVNNSSSSWTDYAIVAGNNRGSVINSYYNNALTDTYGTAISASEAEAKINAGLNTTFNGNIAMTLSTVTLSTTSTLSDLGLSSNAYITVNNSGSEAVVTIASSDTVQSMLNKLNSYGITGSVSDGKLTLSGDSTHYIKGMTNTLSTALKLKVGENYTYTSQINYSNTSSSQQGDTSISTLKTSETLANYGLSGSEYITVVQNGTEKIITVDSSKTVDSIFSELNSLGITTSLIDGKVTLSGNENSYITGISSSLSNLLQLEAGENHTFVVNSLITNTDSSQLGDIVTKTITSDETLTNYGLSGSEYITVVQNGTEKIITVDSSKTVDSIFSELNSLGITTSLIDGKITLSGNENSYILGISSALQDVLSLEAGQGHTWTSTSNAIFTTAGSSVTSASPITYTLDSIATGSTVLSELGVNNTNNTIVINTSSGAKTTITVSNTSTVNDLLNQIKSNSSNGITGSISNGVITLNSSNGSYITGALADLLGIGLNSTTTTVGKTSTSTATVTATLVSSATVSTTLNDLGIVSASKGKFLNSITRLSEADAQAQGYTIIKTAQQLQDMANCLNDKYILMNDIDLSGFNWTAIGSSVEEFAGELEGNGYVIKNLTINNLDKGDQGLFSCTRGAEIKNVGLENVNVYGDSSTGGLVGDNAGTISNCYVIGNIESDSGFVGGLVGYNSGIISNSYFSGTVIAEGDVGGLVGYTSGDITNCYATGSVTAKSASNAGGLIGYAQNGAEIRSSFASVDVNGIDRVGGFVGYSYWYPHFYNCYASGNVTGNNYVGGFIGSERSGGSGDNLYASGHVTGNQFVGGFSGGNLGYITSSYYDPQGTGMNVAVGEGSYASVTTITTSELNSKIQSGDIWTPDNFIIVKNSSNELGGFVIGSDTTINEIFMNLSSMGVNGSINNGVITISNGYILGSVAQNLGINLNGFSNTTSTQYNNISTIITLKADDTLSGYGLSSNAYITVNNAGTNVKITIASSDTVQSMLNKLSSYGITGSVSDGKLTLSGDSTHYIKGMTNTLSTALKFKVGKNNTYTSQINYSNTSSSQQGDISISTLKTSETLANYGLSGSEYITVVQNGTEKIITIDSSKTVDSIFSELNSLGITTSLIDGKVTLSGDENSYILGISSNLLDVLNLEAGEGFTYVSTNNTEYYNTSSSTLESKEAQVITGETILSKIDGYENGNGKLLVHKDNGQYETITIDSSDTVDEFFSKLEAYGLVGSISDGIVTISGLGNVYLQSIDGGSNILTSMNIGNVITTIQTVKVGSTSSLTYSVTAGATGTTTLEDLFLSNGTRIDFTGDNANLVVETSIGSDTNKFTLAFSKTSTLNDIINGLRAFDINASIGPNGEFSLQSSKYDSYIIGGTIGEFLLGTSYTQNSISNLSSSSSISTSDVLLQTGSSGVSDKTTLSSLGITDGDFIISQNGVDYTVNTDGIKTLGSFRSFIELYGFDSYVDSQGRLNILSTGNNILKSVAGGSNILEVLGLTNWNNNNLTQSSSTLEEVVENIEFADWDSTLSALEDDFGNNLGITSGNIFVVNESGAKELIHIDANSTLSELSQELLKHNISMQVSNGQIIFEGIDGAYLTTSGLQNYSNILEKLKITNWNTETNYINSTLSFTTTQEQEKVADENTLLASLGVTAGEYCIYKDGVKYTLYISNEETLGSFMADLEKYGLETAIFDGKLNVLGNGNSYISSSSNINNSSNVLDILFESSETLYNYSNTQQISSTQTTLVRPSEASLISDFAGNIYGDNDGELRVTVDGVCSTITITTEETFGSFIEKLNNLGITSNLLDGNFIIQGFGKSISIEESSSHLLSNLGMIYSSQLGGYSQSSDVVESEILREETVNLSVANWADGSTKLELLNISDGELSIFLNGQKIKININSEETFDDLRMRLSAASPNLTLSLDSGYLKIYSKVSSDQVEVGSTTDTTNLVAVTGMSSSGDGFAISARELFKVNENSRIMEEGLFRTGNVAAGTFEIGNAIFSIDETTTISNLISQINSSEESNATAYWDNILGKLVIKSRTTGAAVINISTVNIEDALDSNNQSKKSFTDIMGYTSTEMNSNGNEYSKLNISSQNLGQNAKFSINGTSYVSTSNKITSDISRIAGLTIDLKGISEEGASTTITVEKDKESLANAVSEVVDSYNELIKNVDEAIANDGELHDQSTLKLIRNQLRNLMISSDPGADVFKNLNAIGICIEQASANNIAVNNISTLTFNKEKFIEAFDSDSDSLKALLIGGDNNNGIFTNVEILIENTLKAYTGYFDSAERAYSRDISNYDDKITRANYALEKYKETLERKFSAMDFSIGKIQQQYSSFLGI